MSVLLHGTVVRGLGVAGVELGFPTANLDVHGAMLVPDGVYAGFVTVGDKTYDAAICIGADGKKKVEAHVIGTSLDLVNKTIDVEVFESVSDLVPWESAAQMRQKITDDIARVQHTLAVYRSGAWCAVPTSNNPHNPS